MVSFLLPPLGNFRPSPCGSSSLRRRGQSPLSPHQGKAAPRSQPPACVWPVSASPKAGGGFSSCFLVRANQAEARAAGSQRCLRGDLGSSWTGRGGTELRWRRAPARRWGQERCWQGHWWASEGRVKDRRAQEGNEGGGSFADDPGVTGSCRPAPAPRWRPAQPRSAWPRLRPFNPCAWWSLSSRSPGWQKWPMAKGTRPCSPPRPCPQTRGCWPP